jgi:hypothetical protein
VHFYRDVSGSGLRSQVCLKRSKAVVPAFTVHTEYNERTVFYHITLSECGFWKTPSYIAQIYSFLIPDNSSHISP